MRVTPETFIKDSSPSAQCAWQMSFSGDTPRADKDTPVMQLWIKTGLGGHLRAHTKHAWGSQAFLSKASWMSKALIECILRNALGSPVWHSSIPTSQDLPAVPGAHRALPQLSCTHGSDPGTGSGAKLHSSRSWLPLVQQHTAATQQCLPSWGLTDYTTCLSLAEFAFLRPNIKEKLLEGTNQAALLCNAVQQSDILAQMYTAYNP